MKIKIFILLLISLFNGMFALAQVDTFNLTDTLDQKLFNYAKNTPPRLSRDVDRLTQYLIQADTNKKNIVKTLSYWIMQNIIYDFDAFINSTYNEEGITGTLKNRKGVCQDYSELFKAMCDRAGIPCYVINGYAKGFGYTPGLKFDKSNHAWNIIWLDNNYISMDLTWASGYIEYVDNGWKYFSKPDISQLFAAPENFVEKHLPADPKWQLLHYPVSMNSFLKFQDQKDMLKDSSHYYSFRDSIRMLDKLDTDARELKSAEDAYKFYPVKSEYAFHYYRLAVTYSNAASDYYNSAVQSYNKAVANNTKPQPTGNYSEEVISNAIILYNKALKLLMKISDYADNQIHPDQLMPACNQGIEYANELLKTLK